MFRAKVFYKAVFCIVGVVHFFDVILIRDYSFHYWTAKTLLLLIVGTLSNAITIKYLVHQRTYKNRHFYLWVLILFALTSQQYLVLLQIVVIVYPSVSWLGCAAHYFDCVKFVAITEIALLRFIKYLTGKSLRHQIWKIIAIFMPFIVATVDFTVEAVLYERRKISELTDKLVLEYKIRMIFVGIAIIATLLAAAYRCIRKLNEELEFSSTCFLMLFVMSTYEVFLYFLYTNLYSIHIYRYQFHFDHWNSVFFASYGLVMFYVDNNYKKAVQRNDQESLELHATESESQLPQINQ